MNGAQVTLLIIWALGFGLTVAKHGQPKGNYSVWESMIAIAISSAILWWGGFWGAA